MPLDFIMEVFFVDVCLRACLRCVLEINYVVEKCVLEHVVEMSWISIKGPVEMLPTDNRCYGEGPEGGEQDV